MEPLVHAKGDDNGLKGQYAESRLSITNLRHAKGDDIDLKGQHDESRLLGTNLRYAKGNKNGLKGQYDKSKLLRYNFRPLIHAYGDDNCCADFRLLRINSVAAGLCFDGLSMLK
jgi:hypothetical protein